MTSRDKPRSSNCRLSNNKSEAASVVSALLLSAETGVVISAFDLVVFLLLALKDERAKNRVSRQTKDVGKKIFFTNLEFFEVIGKTLRE